MLWATKDKNWKKALAELQTYYSEHGNLDIKARYETSDGFKLGRWISNLRAKVKTKGLDQTLTEEQQKQLAAELADVLFDQQTDGFAVVFDAGIQSTEVSNSTEEDAAKKYPQKHREPADCSGLNCTGDRACACDG